MNLLESIYEVLLENAFIKPDPSIEHDEVHFQLSSHKENPFLPDWVHKKLTGLKNKDVFAKAIGDAPTKLIHPHEVSSINNTGDRWEDSHWKPHSKKRVEKLYRGNSRIQMPIILHNNETGEMHLLGGHHRLTYNSQKLKRPTPVVLL